MKRLGGGKERKKTIYSLLLQDDADPLENVFLQLSSLLYLELIWERQEGGETVLNVRETEREVFHFQSFRISLIVFII